MEIVFNKLKQAVEKIAIRAGKNTLGLVITEDKIAAAQVEFSAGSCRVMRCGEFEFDGKTSPDNLPRYSDKFREFLKDNGFKAYKAVVGIPAKYLLITSVDVPPVKNPEQRNEIVKIGLERKSKFELSEIAFDYYWPGNGDQSQAAVLSTMKKYTDGITKFLSDCRIVTLCITGSSVGIDLETSPEIACNVIIYPYAVEAVIFEEKKLKAIKHFSSKEGISQLPSEISKNLPWIAGENAKTKLYLFDYGSQNGSLTAKLQGSFEQTEVLVRSKERNSTSGGMLCELAAKLVENAVSGRKIQIDLLHGHAYENKQDKLYRKIAPKIAIAGIVLLVFVGLFLLKWYFDNKEITRLQQQISSISAEAAEAKNIIDRVGFAKSWFGSEPQYLEILRQLTLSFPQQGNVWLSTMAVDESLNQVITGKATREESVLDLLDNLNKNTAFENVKMLYMRKAGKNTDIITFAINLKAKKEY